MNNKIFIISAYKKEYPYTFIEDCYASNDYSECVLVVSVLLAKYPDTEFRIHLLYEGITK